uniref:C-type lectin domain-containing protein n=1 Tax=Poecilia reticulata TaxID=8081 RepID=A0A3P9NLP7_POERE
IRLSVHLGLSALIVSLSSGGRAAAFHCLNCFSFFVPVTDKVILIKENKTWKDALTYCRDHYDDLVTITNMDDQRWIQEKVKEASTPFVWLDGSSFSFRHWKKNFNNPESISDQCAMTVFGDGGRWKNVNCSVRKPFICYDGEMGINKFPPDKNTQK